MGSLGLAITKLLKSKQIPIVLGGSKETTLASTISFLEAYPNGRVLYLFGHPSMNRPYDHDKLTSDSLLRVLTTEQRSRVLLMGTQ